jgi:hypothetical protein
MILCRTGETAHAGGSRPLDGTDVGSRGASTEGGGAVGAEAVVHANALRAGGDEMGQTADGVRRSDSQALALASLACGVAALGWLRILEQDWVNAAVPLLCAGIALVGLSAIGVRLFRVARGRWRREEAGLLGLAALGALAVLVALGALLGVLVVVQPYIGWFGRYALPPRNVLGALLAVTAVCLGIGSIARRERALMTALPGLGLGLVVVAVSYVWEPLADTPSRAVRRFAVLAARSDQEAMLSQFSADSLRHIDERPRTYWGVYGRSVEFVSVDHMYPPAVRNTLLLSVQREGTRATVECLIPMSRHWLDGRGFFGHGSHIYLIREDGAWKIDAYRHWQEWLERFEQRAADKGPAEDPGTPPE